MIGNEGYNRPIQSGGVFCLRATTLPFSSSLGLRLSLFWVSP